MAGDTLEVLMRVAERKVEEKQRELGRTLTRIAAIVDEIIKLEQDAAVAFVTAVAEDDVLALQAAGAFQTRMHVAVLRLKDETLELRETEKGQRAELQELFANQKRFEMLLEKKKLAERKERAKKAQNNLDDIAGRKR